MENSSKRLCTEEAKADSNNDVLVEDQTQSFNSFKNIKLKKVLNQVEQHKTIYLSAEVEGSSDKCVVILEKKPFSVQSIDRILSDDTKLEQVFSNDIYSLYEGIIPQELNPLKVTIIYPATERHLQKYSLQKRHLVVETPELYKNVVLPHIKQQQLSLQWLYNILEHKAEKERIIFEDEDPKRGFILLPDLKWDGKNMEQLYITAICHRRDIRSIRDLNAEHLPFLEYLKSKSLDVLKDTFSLPADQFRMYLHYQPSYYHLHLHICVLSYEPPGIQCEKGHLLDTVMSNLKLMSDYYSKISLTYVLSESDPLYAKVRESLDQN